MSLESGVSSVARPGRSFLEVAWQIGWRDLKANRRISPVMLVRYLVQPLVQAGLFWLLFSGILRLDFSRSVGSYPTFLLAGLLAWTFVSTVVGGAALCLDSNAGLIRRVAFPHEALVYAVAVQGIVQAGVTAGALGAVILLYPGAHATGMSMSLLWLVPVFTLLGMLSIGLGLMAAALSAIAPDSGLAVPLALQGWFYATPLLYPPAAAPAWLAASFRWNPLAVLVEAIRGVVLNGVPPNGGALLYAVAVAAVVFGTGRALFGWCDRVLPDVV